MEPPSADGEDGLAPGTMLGEYQVERTLARGGMGTVFAATHPLIGKRVAIKVLSRALCSDPASVERFVDEARVVNRIGHPNIVDVFAFGAMPDGRQYLVMELLQGETLGARMARGPVPLAEACGVMKPLARALAAAHAHGVIHRDLKPDNVFLVAVEGGPMVKLLDFGIAKLAHQDTVNRTAAGALVGTPQYIAPEQARGQRVDARSDIYAFGGILFELLAGRPVFLVHSVTEAIAKHLLEAAPRLSQFAQVPSELDDLVAAMLSKDPAERPGLDRIWEALDRAATPPVRPSEPPPVAFASTAPAMARPAVPGVARAGRSRLRAVAVLGAALAVAAVALAWAYLARPRPERPDLRDEVSTSAAPSRTAAVPPTGAEVAPAETAAPPAETVAPPSVPAAVASPPEASAARPPEAPAAVAPPPEAPTPEPAPQTAATAPAGPAEAAEPTDATTDATADARSASGATAGDGKPRGPAMPRTRSRRTGRLELAIHGARSFLVLVDGVAQGARSGLVLAPGSHAIEVRAAGELPRRFTVQIEPGKTAQRDVAWTHDAPSPAPPVPVPVPAPAPGPAPGDDHALMGPGEAVPRETRHP